jgi:hypothetical protein
MESLSSEKKISLFKSCANVNAVRADDGYVYCYRLLDWRNPVNCRCQTDVQASMEW